MSNACVWIAFVRVARKTAKARQILLENGHLAWVPLSQTIEFEPDARPPFIGIASWLYDQKPELRDCGIYERPAWGEPSQAPRPYSWRIVLGFCDSEAVDPGRLKGRYRALSMLLHPDRGGSVEAMQRLNSARDAAEREIQQSAQQV